jgi:hypothetical protein
MKGVQYVARTKLGGTLRQALSGDNRIITLTRRQARAILRSARLPWGFNRFGYHS